jgi:hypothetical protein
MIPKELEKLIDEWKGSNKLLPTWIREDPIQDSKTHCSMNLMAMGQTLKRR